ncbi:MAG: alpha-glucuronidase, partial [Pedobacter sp.]
MKTFSLLLSCLLFTSVLPAQTSHQLWLQEKLPAAVNVVASVRSPTLSIASDELVKNWQGKPGATITLKLAKNKLIRNDGFLLSESTVESNTETGILYGVFEMLRRQQTGQPISSQVFNPSYKNRLLNHWDNPNGSIERGYAGQSIFWRKDSSFVITQQDLHLWKEYARANASVGINGAVLNNVNASHLILTSDYLLRVKAIA